MSILAVSVVYWSAFQATLGSINVASNVIAPPILFLSSVFHQHEVAPIPIRALALANPLTYVADMFRAGLLGLQISHLPDEILLLVVESLGMFVVPIKAFKGIRI